MQRNGKKRMIIQGKRDGAAALSVKNAGKALLLLATGIVLGTFLLTLAYMLPVNEENRQNSYAVLDREGWYPRTSVISPGEHFGDFYPDVLDNSSDRIMLSTAMDSSAGNPLVRAMESYSEYAGNYNYYWHGYVTILRPLFLLFDFSELRIVNGICQILLVGVLVCLIGREKSIRHALAFLTSYLLLEPRTVAMGLQYTWIFYIAFGGLLVLLLKRNYFEENSRYVYFFVAAGMLTSYFDLLTYPLFTWGFPLVWWIMMGEQERKAIGWVKSVILSGFAWIFGYAGMWAAKWRIATIVLKRDIIEVAVDEVFLRSGMAETGADHLAARWNAIGINWRHYEYKIYGILLAGWLFWWLFCSVRKKWNKSSKGYAFFLIGISGIVWYFVLSNHTTIHHFFTHRIYGVSIAAFLAILLESMEHFGENEKRSWKNRAVLLGMMSLSAAAAFFCAMLAREEVFVKNDDTGGFQRQQVSRMAEMEIVPSADIIKSINIGIECESRAGRYEVKVWKGDHLKYENILPLEDCEGGYYHSLTTWWALKRGEPYRITIEAVGADAPAFIWFKEDDNTPLLELGDLSIDGSAAGGQMLAGIRYMSRDPVPGKRRLFLTLTWFGVFMAAIYAGSGTKTGGLCAGGGHRNFER